jgi:hypothetical protein
VEAVAEGAVVSRREAPRRVQVDHPPSRIIGDINERTTRLRSRNASHFAHSSFVATFELKDIGHALFDPNWVNAMHEELENFERNLVWELVEPPPNCKPIGTVGEVGLRKHHPPSATLATFGLSTASVSWGSLRCTGANKTLMPLMPCKFCCAGMIPRGGAYLRCRRYGWPCSGDEGTRGPGTRRAGRGHRVRGPWRHGQGARRGATPPVQDRSFVTEGATILDTWLLPTCKVSSGQGRDMGGRV